MQVIEMFSQAEMEASMLSIDDKIKIATAAITKILEEGRPCVVAYSSGKDSSVLANLSLNAAKEFALRGGAPMVLIQTADTLVENPELVQHYAAEHRKMEAFGKKHGFKLITQVARPSLASTFQVKILTGRGIPSFAGGSTDCSVDLKTSNLASFRAKLFRSLASENLPEPTTVVGVRLDESAVRAIRMKARGDRADEAVRNKDGALVLCPIAMWSEDDVWEYIGLCSSSLLDTYSDFQEMRRIYGASMGTSCAVVADALYEGSKRPKSSGCGARLDIIYVSLSGYGQTGPWRNRPAYAPTVQAETGHTDSLSRHYGDALTSPKNDGSSHADIYTGLQGVIAVLAALAHRNRTGEGQHVDVSMAATMLSINERAGAQLSNVDVDGELYALSASESPIFELADGRKLTLVGNPIFTPFFTRYCSVMRRGDLLKSPLYATPRLPRGQHCAVPAGSS